MQSGFCEYCGMPVKSGEKFCHSCGAANKSFVAEDEEKFNMQYKIVKEESKTVKFIMIGMVAFAAIVCGAVFAIFKMCM